MRPVFILFSLFCFPFLLLAVTDSILAQQEPADENNNVITLVSSVPPSTSAPDQETTSSAAEDGSSISANSSFNSTAAAANGTKKPLPPFDYEGYFVDESAEYSQALRGFCRWTTSDSLCSGTMVPIILTTIVLLIALLYNCVITPQKGALLDPGLVRESPLFPASLKNLSDDEVNEIVSSASSLPLKDLFPLLGLESLVTRAAALGLATLKDLLVANSLAIRDIGIEVKEQRILARSLERIAQYARRVVAEKRKNKRDRKHSMTAGGGRQQTFASIFGLADGGGAQQQQASATAAAAAESGPANESPLLFSSPSFAHQQNTARRNTRGLSMAGGRNRGMSTTMTAGGGGSPFGLGDNDDSSATELRAMPSISVAPSRGGFDPRTPRSRGGTAYYEDQQPPPQSTTRNKNGGGGENDDDNDADDQQQPARSAAATAGANRWGRVRARLQAMAALNAMESLMDGGGDAKRGNIDLMDI